MSFMHLPVPIFREQGCRVLLVGWVCLRCGIALHAAGEFRADLESVPRSVVPELSSTEIRELELV
jgi:hypothetical protein